MIAMALIMRPALLVADEPTTALDVTTQAQILALLGRLQDETGMAILLITTIWASSPTSPTTWRCSTAAGWSRRAPRTW